MRMMSLMMLALVACAAPSAAEPAAMPDGIHEVLAIAERPEEAAGDGREGVLFLHEDLFTREDQRAAPRWVRLAREGGAPLDLAEPVRRVETERSPMLMVQLSPSAGRQLARLTAEPKQVAVVIGGEVISIHKVRAPITGGALQISC